MAVFLSSAILALTAQCAPHGGPSVARPFQSLSYRLGAGDKQNARAEERCFRGRCPGGLGNITSPQLDDIPEHAAFLHRKVEVARASMRDGLGRSNEEAEAAFAARPAA